MEIFIVVRGERCEGYIVRSVHATYASAIGAAHALMGDKKDEYRLHSDEATELGAILYYQRGCDYIAIVQEEVTL